MSGSRSTTSVPVALIAGAFDVLKYIVKHPTKALIATLLLTKPSAVESVAENLDKLWVSAIETGNLEDVKSIFENKHIYGFDVFKQYRKQATYPGYGDYATKDVVVKFDALTLATYHGQEKILPYLFAKGFYKRQENYPLFERCSFVAVDFQKKRIPEILRSLGADFSKDLALVFARISSHLREADPYSIPVLDAIDIRNVNALLLHGANPNIRMAGVPLITVASVFNSIQLVHVLLAHHADMYPVYKYQWPISAAIHNRNAKMIEAYCQHGYNITKRDEDNLSLVEEIAGIKMMALHGPDKELADFISELRLSKHTKKLFEQVDHIDQKKLADRHAEIMFRHVVRAITSSFPFGVLISFLPNLIAYLLSNKKYQPKNIDSHRVTTNNTEQEARTNVQTQEKQTESISSPDGVTKTMAVPVAKNQDAVSGEALDVIRSIREERRKKKQEAAEAEERIRQQKKLEKQFSIERAEREKAQADIAKKQHAEERRKIREEKKQKAKIEKEQKKTEIKTNPPVSRSMVTFFSENNDHGFFLRARAPDAITVADKSRLFEKLECQEVASYIYPLRAAVNTVSHHVADDVLIMYALLGSCARLIEFKKNNGIFRKQLARAFRDTVFHQDELTTDLLPAARALSTKICALYSEDNVTPRKQRIRAVFNDTLFIRFAAATRDEEKNNSPAVCQARLEQFVSLQAQFKQCSAGIDKSVVLAGQGLAIARAGAFAGRLFGEDVKEIARNYRHNQGSYTAKLTLFLSTQSNSSSVSSATSTVAEVKPDHPSENASALRLRSTASVFVPRSGLR